MGGRQYGQLGGLERGLKTELFLLPQGPTPWFLPPLPWRPKRLQVEQHWSDFSS